MTKEILSKLERLEVLVTSLSDSLNKPLDLKEAADYLHLSTSHLYQLTSKGLIPHYKPNGKKIYFDRKDLNGYLFRHRVASAEELEGTAASHIVNRPFKDLVSGRMPRAKGGEFSDQE